jgi:hypothetical protein
LGALVNWIESATTRELSRFIGAVRGGEILLVGESPPVIAGAVRYHGRELLVPLGFRTTPNWPEEHLLAACAVIKGERIIVDESGLTRVPAGALRSISRASLRHEAVNA